MAEKQRKVRVGTSHLYALLMILFLAFALTSGMVGFALGRNAAHSTGELVDTIVLSPGESELESVEALRNLSGRLLRKSGEPFVQASVTLGGESQSDVTDEQGRFFFSGLRAGKHTLSVRDSDGKDVTSLQLSVDFSGAEISADFGGEPNFKMTEDAKLLEFTMTVDDDLNAEIEAGNAYFVTRGGQIVDFDGTALRVQQPEIAVTPVGSVVGSSGYVMLPNRETLLTPIGGREEITPDEEIFPGVGIDGNGNVITEGGVTVEPDGDVVLPDGDTVADDETVIITGGDAAAVPELPDKYVPDSEIERDEIADTPADDSETPPTESSDVESSEADHGEYGGLSIIDRETGLSWRQQSFINLFKKRGTVNTVGTEAEEDAIAPGTKGYYEFRLENPEDFDIIYSVAIKETSFHLPMRFSVVNQKNNYSYLYRDRTTESGEALKTKLITIPAGTVQNFRIDWEWAYEDWFRPEKDDVLDTNAAVSEDRTYMISVLIEAEQIVKQPEIETDGETRYPGIH